MSESTPVRDPQQESGARLLRQPGATPRPSRLRRLTHRPEVGAVIGVVVVFVFFAITAGSHGFLTLAGTASWIDVAAVLGVVAIPVGLLMIGGEFDLSVGSVVGMASMVVPICVEHYQWPLWAAVLLALLIGWLIGFVNGVLVTRTGIASFIVTLGTMLVIAGLTLGVSNVIVGTTTLSIDTHGSLNSAFAASRHGYDVSLLWWLGIAVVATWVLTQTPFGNWIFATGADREAAVLAGVPTRFVKILLYMGTATGGVLVGTIQTLQYGGGNVTGGQNYVYESIIAAVIGGVLLTGGYGSALGISLGAMTYGMVSIGIFYTGWDTNWVQLSLGLLLLAAVMANSYFRKLATSR